MPYSQRTSVILLSFIEFFERFSYYGVRALLILYVTVDLGMERGSALNYYAWFSAFIFMIPLPAGIISDLFFKQKQGVFYGGIIALLGYGLLISGQIQMLGIGVVLIGIGTGLIKPNLTVLVGRLFEKTDKNRGFAFMFYYLMINMGAFISILILGYLGETFGFRLGFVLATISTMLFLILFYLTKDRLRIVETNVDERYIENNQINDSILDAELTESKSFNPNPHILILIVTFIIIFFWQTLELISTQIYIFLSENDSLSFGHMILDNNILQTFNSLFIIPITLIFYIIWYYKGLGSTLIKIAFAMILMGLAALIVANFNSLNGENFILFLGPTILFYSIAEILIAPFVLSYITRLSDVRYSSTIVGLFMFLPAFGYKISGLISEHLFSYSFHLFISISVISISIGLLLMFFRKKLLKMSGGLD